MMLRDFKYGLRPPSTNEDGVRKQMTLASEYRTALTRTERNKRRLRLAAMEWVAEFRDTRAVALAARDRKRHAESLAAAERARTGRRELSANMRWWLDAAKEDDRAATNAFMSCYRRTMRRGELRHAFDSIHAGVLKEQALLREEFGHRGRGLYWSTYNIVAAAAEAAAKDVPEFGRTINGAYIPGPDHHWPQEAEDGATVSLGAQLQGGIDGSEVFGGDTQIEIVPLVASKSEARSERLAAHRARNAARRADARTTTEAKRSFARERAGQWLLRMRIGSTGAGNRQPIWAEWPIFLHRPLPAAAKIMQAAVTCRRVARHEEWSCQITVQTTEQKAGLEPGSGVVGVDIGWRQIGDALRVCAFWGEDGEAGMDLRLSADIISALRKCEELRSIRDGKRDVFLPRMRAALASIPDAPQWLRERTKTLERWESCNRIHNLLAEWKEQGRIAGDKRAYTMLCGFCYRDHHLWEWEDCQRKKAIRRRREGYRAFAGALAKTYGVCALEDFDLRKIARRKPVGDDEKAENETARSNRVLACTSELRDCLIKAFRAHGGLAVAMPAQDTTRECHITRTVEVFDAAAKIRHRTALTEWDQDDNAAHNLVQRYRERPSDAEILGGARKDKNTGEVVEMAGGRYRRAKSEKARKATENGTARKTIDNVAE